MIYYVYFIVIVWNQHKSIYTLWKGLSVVCAYHCELWSIVDIKHGLISRKKTQKAVNDDDDAHIIILK